MFGAMLSYVALPYQIYELTHSSLAVGAIGLAELIPLLITSLWGGALADKMDRRKLLIIAECVLALNCLLLAVNSLLPQPSLSLIYIAACIGSAVNGFHRPTLEALTPTLVQQKDMSSMAALNSIKYTINMLAGPAIAGILMAKWGMVWVYSIDLITFLISLAAILCINCPFVLPANNESITRSIISGMRYAASRQELIGTYLVDIVAMIFGMPQALFPAMAQQFGGAAVVGWFYSAPALGSLIASLFSGWTNTFQRHGLGVAVSASIWGLAIIGFGLAPNAFLAIAALVVAGAADSVSGIFRMTMWNQTIPSHYRGRLAGIEMLSYMSGPLLGNAEAGFVAALFGTTVSVVSGGVFCIIGVALATLALPNFWRYHANRWQAQQKIEQPSISSYSN
jgi:MFS family permease